MSEARRQPTPSMHHAGSHFPNLFCVFCVSVWPGARSVLAKKRRRQRGRVCLSRLRCDHTVCSYFSERAMLAVWLAALQSSVYQLLRPSPPFPRRLSARNSSDKTRQNDSGIRPDLFGAAHNSPKPLLPGVFFLSPLAPFIPLPLFIHTRSGLVVISRLSEKATSWKMA